MFLLLLSYIVFNFLCEKALFIFIRDHFRIYSREEFSKEVLRSDIYWNWLPARLNKRAGYVCGFTTQSILNSRLSLVVLALSGISVYFLCENNVLLLSKFISELLLFFFTLVDESKDLFYNQIKVLMKNVYSL